LCIAGAVIFAVQFLAIAALSQVQYNRFDLAEDFGIFNQAWTLIAHGHLNPYSSIYGYPFYKSHFELIMWPMALLHLIYPQPVLLLWIQDLAAVGCGLVVYLWTLEYMRRRELPLQPAVAIALGVVAALAVNPVLYETVTFDFHLQTVSTLFALLAAREFWRGRIRWAWVWVGLTLLCGDLPALYVVGLGFSALLAGRALWRSSSS
jgi:uncharacterized membrane protein